MQCPVDSETLVMSERNGVEIDYCPKCRGVWLDRGELDKIIERTAAPAPASGPTPEARSSHRDRDDDRRPGEQPRRKRESFLGELFDF